MVIKHDNDTELLHQTYDPPTCPVSLQLPPAFWQTVKPGSDLYLEVVAHTAGNHKSVLAERVPLAGPMYVTHLVTDKPMYRPGEVVRFRSLTLDRASFLPPGHDLNLGFRLYKPDGGIDTEASIDGNGRLVQNLKPVLGPDGKPLRGIGVGEYQIPENFPGGEYTLTVVDKGDGRPNGEAVLDRRRFLVNHYVPDVLEKSLEFGGKTYGPGDTVEARIEVSRTAGGTIQAPKAAAVTATLNGQPIYTAKDVAFQVGSDPKTGKPRGFLNVRFQLPGDLNEGRRADQSVAANLTVTIADGNVTEQILRPVPLVERELRVEFFPEGGDLVAGVRGHVYFQVRTPSGKPADLRGEITDGTKAVAEIATLTDAEQPGVNRGQGRFEFTPEAGKNYFLKLKSPTGIDAPTENGFPLPDVKADGVVLTALDAVTEANKPIRVRLEALKAKVLHVGAYSRGRLVAQQRVEVAAGKP